MQTSALKKNFSASQIASALRITPTSVREQLHGIDAADVRTIAGNATKVYAVAQFPARLLARLDAEARRQQCKGADAVQRVEVLLAMPRLQWMPRDKQTKAVIALSEICAADIARAEKLREALKPFLVKPRDPATSANEWKQWGVDYYTRIFGEAGRITPRQWDKLLRRAQLRDNGLEVWDSLQIYLLDRWKLKSEPATPARDAADEVFPNLESYLDSHPNPNTWDDDMRAGLWALVMTEFSSRLLAGETEKSAARRLRKFLFERASFLADSRDTLLKAFNRKIEKLAAADGNVRALQQDCRGGANKYVMPDGDKKILRSGAAIYNSGRVDAAWREKYYDLSETTRGRYDYSFKAPRPVHEEVNRQWVDLLHTRHHGGKRALARAIGTLHGDRWAGIPSMYSWAVDDVTSNVQCYLEGIKGLKGEDVLCLPQIICVMDSASRKIVGWSMSDDKAPNAPLVCEAVVNAFKTHKIPKQLWVENGWVFGRSVLVNGKEDDMGRTVITGLAQYGCSLHHFGKMNPTAKAELERSFEAIQRLMARQPGYTGRHQMFDAPDEFKREERLIQSGKKPAKDFRYSLENFRIVIQELIDQYNATENHGEHMGGLSPNDAFVAMQNLNDPPIEYDPQLEWWFAPEKTVVTVKAGGVRFDHKTSKRSLKVWGGRLADPELLGKELRAMVHPLDPSIVTFMNLDFTDPFTMEIGNTPSARERSLAPASDALASELAKKREHVQAIEHDYKNLLSGHGNPRRELLARFRTDATAENNLPTRRRTMISPQMRETGELVKQQIAEIHDGREQKQNHHRQAERLVKTTGLHLSPEALAKLAPEQILKMTKNLKSKQPDESL